MNHSIADLLGGSIVYWGGVESGGRHLQRNNHDMTDFTTLLQQGNAWFFIPSAILLGALHGLEPGHSKTMMAAFIVAIKGTVRQAVMLGLAATVSHTVIVWLIAFGGMYLSKKFTAQSAEPWLQLVSAIVILGTAFWMFRRTWQGERNGLQEMLSHHHHDHDHDHDHDHSHGELVGMEKGTPAYQDAHERFHANEIKKRFTDREVTNGQILLFGLTGGLIPCPAAVTVMLICIQLKALTLGATMVVSFSVGLALTLVTVGAGAAISVRHAAKHWGGFNKIARRAPYFSSILIALVGAYMAVHGLYGILG